MDRRTFLGSVALAVLAAPLVAAAQQAEKVWRIGVLASAPGDSPLLEAFRQGLRELGYVEGQNVRFEYRFAAGQNNLLARPRNREAKRLGGFQYSRRARVLPVAPQADRPASYH